MKFSGAFMRDRKIKFALIFLALAPVLWSCASDPKPTVTPKAEAIKNWNDARAVVMLGLARDQYNQAHFDKARETVDQALRLAPDNATAHILSAKLDIEGAQLEAAEQELDLARTLDPKGAEAEYLSGVVYQRWQQPEKALDFYQHACDKAPAELEYVMAKAEMLVALDRQPEALSLLQSKVVYFEHSAVIRDAVGLLLMQQGQYDQAVDMLRRASILGADDATIREHLATALYYQKHYSDCADVLSRLVKEDHYQDRPDLILMLGECQMQTGRAGDALANFQAAADAMPTLPGVWLAIARAALQLDQIERSDLAVHKALVVDPNNSESYLLLGYLKLKQNSPQEALRAFQQASTLSPQDTTGLCMIGYTLDKLGRHDLAMNYYAQALKQNPTDEMATQLMARVDLHE
jgi:tetratricopeptide (TPR) repeat protein